MRVRRGAAAAFLCERKQQNECNRRTGDWQHAVAEPGDPAQKIGLHGKPPLSNRSGCASERRIHGGKSHEIGLRYGSRPECPQDHDPGIRLRNVPATTRIGSPHDKSRRFLSLLFASAIIFYAQENMPALFRHCRCYPLTSPDSWIGGPGIQACRRSEDHPGIPETFEAEALRFRLTALRLGLHAESRLRCEAGLYNTGSAGKGEYGF